MDLTNFLEHSNCWYYIYITLDTTNGKYYIGKHKCKRVGKYEKWYKGSGSFVQQMKRDGKFDGLLNTSLWWCETLTEAMYWEQFFIDYFDAVELGLNITSGGEGVGNSLSNRIEYWNYRFCNKERIEYTDLQMKEFAKQERLKKAKEYKFRINYRETRKEQEKRNRECKKKEKMLQKSLLNALIISLFNNKSKNVTN